MEITSNIKDFLLGDWFTGGANAYRRARIAEIEAEAELSGASSEELSGRAKNSLWLQDAVIEQNRKLSREYRAGYSDDDFRNGIVEDHSSQNHDAIYDSVENYDFESLRFYHRLMTHNNVALLRIVFTHATNLGVTPGSLTSENVEAYRLITYRLLRRRDNDRWVARYDTAVPGMDHTASNALIRRVLTDNDFVQHVLNTAPTYIEDRNPKDSSELVVHILETLGTATPFTRGSL